MKTQLSQDQITRFCERVEGAQTRAYAIPKLTNEFAEMTVEDGYFVQNALRKRFIEQGQRLVGWKAGLTSKAKMQQMGVSVPTIGFLTDAMSVPENTVVDTAELVHPRVELEVAFVTKAELSGPGCTASDVLAATDFILPAIEVIDSRYENFKFDLPSVVADNSSSAKFVAGSRLRYAEDVELDCLGVVLEINGEIVETGSSAAVLGHPAEAMAMLVNILADMGEVLPAGSFVMSGGITAAAAVKPGDSVVARYQELGSVSVHFS